MSKFQYTAKRGPEDVIEGVIEAENRGGVLEYLTQLGYVPVRINEQTVVVDRQSERQAPATRVIRKRVPSSHLTVFTRQFASLVRSAVPLLRALKILEEQARHPRLRAVLREVMEDVRQGENLSAALAKFPAVFSDLYVNLIRSGESSGALDVILDQLAKQAEQEDAMRARVRMAFTYPAVVGVVGCGTVIFLMTFVMPRLSRLLVGLGDRLPLPTRLLLLITGWMSSWWFWAACAVGILGLAVLWRGMGEHGRWILDRLILRAPLLGPLIQQTEIARFARSFGLQINHGISILQAVDVATKVVGHRVIRAELQRLPEGLRQGNTLSNTLNGSIVGTPFLVNTLAVGEESGKIGDALVEVAFYYERETQRLLEVMATVLEPMLILVVGSVVGFIVIAVLLPIFEMSSISP